MVRKTCPPRGAYTTKVDTIREWDQRRYISGERMGDLYDRPMPRPAPDATIGERARRALEASLELAEGLAAA